MDKISPELVERMVVLVRFLASDVAEARAIAVDLPEPTDRDLIEAREIVAMCCLWFTSEDAAEMAKRIRAGAWDDGRSKLVQFTLSALKRGRELAGGAA